MQRQRLTGVLALAIGAVLLLPSVALACGGLVGENGTIELGKTTTLAAYHNGVERYVTAFEFSGEGESLGSIIPLPDVPTKVERGGDWTLQRLVQEITPPARNFALAGGAGASAESDNAEVLLETEVDALDITVLRGGGDAVGTWALEHGFFLPPDAPEVLDFYAERSPIFMAAKFDAGRAASLGQGEGDSTPIMATIPTDDPWVPLRILGLGLPDQKRVEADVFLLTDSEPQLLAGRRGLNVARSERASGALLTDLRSDVGMEWLPGRMWLSYLKLDAAAGNLVYDLAVSVDDSAPPSLEDAGIGPAISTSLDLSGPTWPVGLAVAAATLAFLVLLRRRDQDTSSPVTP